MRVLRLWLPKSNIKKPKNNTSGSIGDEDVLRLPDFKQNDGPFNLKEQERQLIQKALQRFNGPYGKQAAADALGISKATLYRKIQEYHLD